MPKPDGTLYHWEKAEISSAQHRYNQAVNQCKMHANSSSIRIYEDGEKRAFADLMRICTKYAGCR